MPSILAVDVGTTSAKALVINDKGEVLASAREYYPTFRPQPDFSEQDPEAIFIAVKKVVGIAARQANEKVDALSFSSAMHSVLAVDQSGNALTPLMVWSDLRAKAEAIQIKSGRGKEIYWETGTPIHPMSPLCKILWLKNNRPEIFKKTHKFSGIKEYLWFRIFGEYAIDHSIASATGLFNAATKSWSSLALQTAGISDRQLSTPTPVHGTFKTSDKRFSEELGLPAAIPWIIGASDGCLANLGSGAMEADTLSLTIGTSGAVRKTVRKISPDERGRTFHYLLDDETWVTGGAINNGAVLLQWYSDNFLNEKVDIKSFGERASTVAAGSEGLIFLPYILGERAPIFDPEATGVFFGIRHHHKTEHFMRAILEGIGYALFSVAEVVEMNSGSSRSMKASGGFVESPHWVKMIADIFNKEVHVQSNEDASAVGAALLGFRALKMENHFRFPSEKVYKPDSNLHSLYRQYFIVYKSLYPHLSSDFHSLSSVTKT